MRTLRKRFVAAALVLPVSSADDVRADPGPIGQWLVTTPVTLWDRDRGMDRLEMRVENARKAFIGSRAGSGWAWASCDWDNNEFNVGMWLFGYNMPAAHMACNDVRSAFLLELVAHAQPRAAPRFTT